MHTTTPDEHQLLEFIARPGAEYLTTNDFTLLPDNLFGWSPRKIDQVATALHDKHMVAYFGPSISARFFKTNPSDDTGALKQARLRFAGKKMLKLSIHYRPSKAD